MYSYVGGGQHRELHLDVPQVAAIYKYALLAQTTLTGVPCSGEPAATLDEFGRCLRHGSHFTPKATDLKPAILSQLVVYEEYRKAYAAASDAFLQRADVRRDKV